MSTFETAIEQLVKTTLTNESINTSWCLGTLFVSPITNEQAKAVVNSLTPRMREVYPSVEIVATKQGSTPEFSFDFV